MKSDQEQLNKRIHETISGLSDDDLLKMLKLSSSSYTPYALQVARDELTRRYRRTLSPQPVSAVDNSDSELSQRNTDGCYIEIWRGKNYEGEHLRIEGPIQYKTLKADVGDWGNDISSLRVGPDAFVEVFEDEGFKGGMICFGPSEEVSDLGEYKFNDDAESIKIINSIRLLERSRQEVEEEQPKCKESLEKDLAAGNSLHNRKDRKKRKSKKR